jgi:hypothetical protein
MRRNRVRSRAVTLGAVVALSSLGAACSDAEPASTASPTESETGSPEPGGGAAATEYVTAVCGGVVDWLGEIQTLTQEFQETSSGATNIRQVKGAAVDYFDGLLRATETLISSLEDSGVPDVPRGEEAAQHILDGLGEVRTAMQNARARIRDLATDDPQAFVARLREITTEMGRQMSSVGASMEEFEAPELDAAAGDVDSCQGVS